MSTPATDGRVARGERTRTAIVSAFLDLLAEGDPRPTARDVAARAGVSVRSIFQHFEDLEALRGDVVQLQGERIRPLLDDLEPTGDRDARIAALVSARRHLYEYIAPVRRSLSGLETSPAIERGMAVLHRQLRDQVGAQFAPELRTMPRSRAASVLAAVDVLCSFEAWDHLRNAQGLGAATAARSLTVSLELLLA